jgi:hypothetical protein
LRHYIPYYVSDTLGFGSGVGRRTGEKIAGQQDTEPNMEKCSYSGTVRFSYSKP